MISLFIGQLRHNSTRANYYTDAGDPRKGVTGDPARLQRVFYCSKFHLMMGCQDIARMGDKADETYG
jgi:hypothetical protein